MKENKAAENITKKNDLQHDFKQFYLFMICIFYKLQQIN